MTDLKSFLKENIATETYEEIEVSKRFLDEDGKIIKWQIKTINTLADEEIRNTCYKANEDFDYNKYLGKLTANSIVYPNLKNAELQDSYSVKSDDELVKAMLLAGEYANLVSIIQKLNGFDISFDELVEKGKN